MKISPTHLKRYRQIAVLLWKYGRSDVVNQMQLDDPIDAPELKTEPKNDATPEQLADDLEAMGPTYVKLGQVLAGRPDILPEPYVRALARLQDRVKPFSYDEVEQIVVEELGVRISKAFSRFDIEPIAAASLGQVHSAALRDGRLVAVKVQRPGIRKQIAEDFEVLAEIAQFLEAHTDMGRRYRFTVLLEEFRLTIHNELNYEREAQNLVTLGQNLRDFRLIDVPQPVSDYCTRRVLTMDYIQGRKITDVSPIARLDLNGAVLAEELFRAYLKQVLLDGLFHADPHPGNVFLTDEGHLALIDLGMVGHTTPAMQDNLLKVLLAVSEGNSEQAADIVIRISEKTDEFDAEGFRRHITQLLASRQDQGLQQLNVGKALLTVSKNAAENGIHVPSELSLLGKTLLQLDEVGQILDPAFDPNASVRRNATEITTERMKSEATQGSLFGALLETKTFVTGLPSRLNKIMDAIAESKLEVRMKSADAEMVVDGIEKVANRITTGLLLTALIIGGALLTRVQTDFQIFGYPGLAILCFLFAAIGAICLLVNIVVQDHHRRKPSRN